MKTENTPLNNIREEVEKLSEEQISELAEEIGKEYDKLELLYLANKGLNQKVLYQINYSVPDEFRYIETEEGLIKLHNKFKSRFSGEIRKRFRQYLKVNNAKIENDSIYLVDTKLKAINFFEIAESIIERIILEKKQKILISKSKEQIEKIKQQIHWLKVHKEEMTPRVYVREVITKPICVLVGGQK